MWAADGSAITFISERDGDPEIYLLDLSGADFAPGSQTNFTDPNRLRRLTESDGADTNPTFAPDSTKVAFLSDRDGNNEIYQVGVDARHLSASPKTAPTTPILHGTQQQDPRL